MTAAMRALTIAGAVVAVPALFLGLLWLGQRRLIYFPLGDRVEPPGTALPGAVEVRLQTADGLSLGGWLLSADARRAPLVVVFNGNAGNRADRAPLAAAFARAGLSVLLFDYRGYGGNPGKPGERGLIEDGRAAVDWARARPDGDPEKIVYFGESLGAAVAVAVAVERPPAALVLRSPFTSLADVARVHYSWLPVGRLLRDRYPSIERIAALDAPLLVVAGDRDGIVPHEQSRRLFEAAPMAAKRFVTVAGADHNEPRLIFGEETVGAIAEFLDEHVTRGEGR